MNRILLFALLPALALLASPASGQDAAKPAESCYGKVFVDKAGDNKRGHPAFAGEDGTPNLDLIDGFFKHDAAKSETTINIRVKDLDKTVPNGSNSIQWQLQYTGKEGVISFVRAVSDFSGLVTYDYGGQETTPANTINVRKGGTTGAFFEGPDGIVQIVIPADVEPKGQVLKGMTFFAYEPVQAIPGAAPTPVKGGQLYEQDNAGGKGTYAVGAPCPAAPPAAPAPSNTLPTPGPPPGVDDGGPLPVKVSTTKFKAKSVKKGLTLKLSSSEPLTQLAAQVKKGKKVFGKGSLAKLDGKGSMKVKAKGLKKGSYVLDLVGTDSKGARRFKSFKISVR